MHENFFERFAKKIAHWAGQPYAFMLAAAFIVLWALSGPIFGFSDTWQLIVNTSTTIITFLMVFVIQNTQNKDTTAMQLKLDELIRTQKGAHKALMDLEELNETELAQIRDHYEEMAEKARKRLHKQQGDEINIFAKD